MAQLRPCCLQGGDLVTWPAHAMRQQRVHCSAWMPCHCAEAGRHARACLTECAICAQGVRKEGEGAAEVTVVKVKQSGGVVTRPTEARQAARIQRVREYFYGFSHELAPHSQTIPLDDLAGRIYRVGGGPKAPSSALPIGQTSVADPLRQAAPPGRICMLPWQ